MTSTRQIGNRGENEFCAIAEELGYATFCARGSRGPVDVLCFSEEPLEIHADGAWNFYPPRVPLVVQVGTTGKPIERTLIALNEAPRPIGSLALVARRHRAANRRISWTFHTLSGKYHTLQEAIESRERA